ncbi:MAG: CIA30 family protein [Candidatus Zixiibacteriota bacterium]
MTEKEKLTHRLFDFSDESEAESWLPINDDVMGGISRGETLLTEDSCLLFTGEISLENNGGFASIRTRPTDFDLADFHGIRIRVKGDGRRYQFRVRTGREFDSITFKHEFDSVKDKWLAIDLPFSSFQPTFRGRILTGVGPLVPGNIRQFGFLLADKKAGAFELVIDSISAYKQ